MEGRLFFFVSNTEIKGAKKKKMHLMFVCAVTDWKFMGLGATFKKTCGTGAINPLCLFAK